MQWQKQKVRERERKRERECNVKMLFRWLRRWRKVTQAKECAASRSQKRHGNRLSPRVFGRNIVLLTFWFEDFWHIELKGNEFVLFNTTKFVVICYSSNKKMIYSASPGNVHPLSRVPSLQTYQWACWWERQSTQCLYKERVILLTNSATLKSQAHCCIYIHGDSVPWAQSTVALSPLVQTHSPPRVVMKMRASFEASCSDRLYRGLKQDEN